MLWRESCSVWKCSVWKCSVCTGLEVVGEVGEVGEDLEVAERIRIEKSEESNVGEGPKEESVRRRNRREVRGRNTTER